MVDPRLSAWRDELLGPPEEGTCDNCYEEALVYPARYWRAIGDREPRSYTVTLCRTCLGLPAEEEDTRYRRYP